MKIILDGKGLEVEAKTVEAVLEEIGINPETVLVKRSGVLIPHDEIVSEGDSLVSIVVISSG